MRLTQLQRATTTILPLNAAIYHAVRDVKGGVGAIAGAYGRNPSTLQHKTNINSDGRHTLNIREFEEILGFTRDPRIMDSICAIYGDAAWVDLGTATINDGQLLTGAAELFERVGHMARDLAAALADGRVDADELAVLEMDAARLHQTLQSIIARARALLEE